VGVGVGVGVGDGVGVGVGLVPPAMPESLLPPQAVRQRVASKAAAQVFRLIVSSNETPAFGGRRCLELIGVMKVRLPLSGDAGTATSRVTPVRWLLTNAIVRSWPGSNPSR